MIGESDHSTKGLIRLTMACNERCPFCNVPMEDFVERHARPEEIARQLETFVESGQRTLTISGGEPTLLRDRLLSLIQEARKKGIPFVELQTNAVLIDADYAAALAEAGLTSAFVSLLARTAEDHDFLAGLDGAFEPCLEGIGWLLANGIFVTLNPVIARRTQSSLAEYIDFVAARFPQIESISLSAVQPHGRGSKNLSLLPDYDVLAHSVREARQRASIHGITLLNPYCGLPACVGWETDLDRSVEAIESRLRSVGNRPGIQNAGDKSHGEACRDCGVRTRCGGAWHAYWETRGGAGIAPPFESRAPWYPGANRTAGRSVFRIADDECIDWTDLNRADMPTVWLSTSRLSPEWIPELRRSTCTDIALRIPTNRFRIDVPTLRALRRLARLERDRSARDRLRMHVGFEASEDTPDRELLLCLELAARIGVDRIAILSEGEPRWRRIVARLKAKMPFLELVEGPALFAA